MTASSSSLSRRTLFAGAGTAGALAVAVSALPLRPTALEATVVAPQAKPAKGGGYALSEHVKQYYKTTLV